MATGKRIAEIEENKHLRAFLEESEELLEKLNHSLLELEKDTSNLELVHEIFRFTHSLKSESALIGFNNLSQLAHRLEDVFERLRSGSLILARQLLDAIFSAADLIHEMVCGISRGEGDGLVEFRSLVSQLERLAGISPSAVPAARGLEAAEVKELTGPLALDPREAARAREAIERGEAIYQLSFQTEGEALMKYPRAYLIFNNLEQIANVLKTVPDLAEPLEDDEQYSRAAILFSSDLEEQELAKAFAVDQVSDVELKRVDEQALQLIRESGEAAGVDRWTPWTAAQEGREGAAGPVPAAPGSSEPGAAEPVQGRVQRASVRVDTKKLDDLWHLVGELVTCKARFSLLAAGIDSEKPAGELRLDMERITDSLERVTAEMQQAIMETRMVPIAVLFNKFPRLVRDLSRKLGKNVELEIYGKQTEIDRSLVEALSDPLTHLIRNCLDHGIEYADERLKSGKAETGRVTISAQQRGGKIVIEVSDDGRGLDIEKIRLRAAAAPEATDEELINFIFLPGFSTKEGVTELSGRGVGMDVVATRIKEDLKGEVRVTNEPGKGMVVTILLPLTLTILHSLVVSSGRQHYAVPIRDIEETIKVDEEAMRIVGALEMAPWGDGDVPVVRLEAILADGERFGAAAFTTGYQPVNQGAGRQRNGVIIRQKGRSACLLVDELVEEQDVVIKPISELLNPHRFFSGVSVLGDGRIVFILDTARVVELPG